MDRDQERATQEKYVLEEAQRREARERGDRAWSPRLFALDPASNDWRYKYAGYVHTLMCPGTVQLERGLVDQQLSTLLHWSNGESTWPLAGQGLL